ncbi:uncharacterized protein PGTG_18108 [Puccinia graminis f. sp. tritici CRL 75-36-700-3]|uniref:OTU domain-containing protein n=1 Tax=Puccinia graminis f. sp. tritici (strain CRL 75-36-700-3 / race SCCL) TaxID=418459 RepID=E3L6N6_PUCGT|nr:uncharacterized protein PGTG_18108 [Puccinia graminis f. sp. tritici CRL 75-36-700-3]EFP92211.2 hypothetical protein PGTG_18108 [Puccinia graminis f. sp. tritici CRL 75-36-700-3]
MRSALWLIGLSSRMASDYFTCTSALCSLYRSVSAARRRGFRHGSSVLPWTRYNSRYASVTAPESFVKSQVPPAESLGQEEGLGLIFPSDGSPKLFLQGPPPNLSVREDELTERRKDLQAQLSSLNPIQENTKLDQISRVLDGSAAIVNIKKPKANPKSRAKPKPHTFSKKVKLEDLSPPSRTLSQLTGSSSQSITILNPQQISQPPKKKFRPICTSNLLEHLPDFIQPHVEKFENVKSDGHCGFRAAAFCFGKGKGSFLNIQNQLDDEITERKDFYLKIGCFENSKQWENTLARIKTNSAAPVGEEHWMSMPMTAEPLANAFSTPVFYFSKTGSQGFFPLFTPANNNPPIFIAFIPESSHFVALTLKDPLNSPFPYYVG